MIKNKVIGSTLIELLVSISVIGVIFFFTISPFMRSLNTKDLQAGFFNGYLILKNASAMLLVENNGSIANLYDTPDDFSNALKGKLKVIESCSAAQTLGNCWASDVKRLSREGNFGPDYYSPGSSDSVILANGMSLFVETTPAAYDSTCSAIDFYTKPNYDSNYCAMVFLDVNGLKPPNVMGRDVFVFYYINKLGFVPNGSVYTDDAAEGTYCSLTPTGNAWNGAGCGGKIVREGNMNY